MPAWRRPEFVEGARDMSGIAPGVAAWGLVTGVAMANSGMGVPLAVVMSLLVFSGTAQLATLPLIVSGAPLWVVWATTACVNLRFVVLSAAWRPYFCEYPARLRWAVAYFSADLNFVLFMRRFPDPRPAAGQLPYFWGGSLVNWGSWQVSSLVGIALADLVPGHWGIGFAGVLALVGLTCSMLVDRATWITAAVAASAAVAAYSLPLKLNIVVALAAAVAAGMLLDQAARAGGKSGREP